MNIERKMEYAMNLADPDFKHEFEDFYKLASLCEEIAILKSSTAEYSPVIETEYADLIKQFIKSNGSFRSEIERLPAAKSYIESL